jgi:hypothetical protein
MRSLDFSCRELSKERWQHGLHGAEEKVPKTLSATDEPLVRFNIIQPLELYNLKSKKNLSINQCPSFLAEVTGNRDLSSPVTFKGPTAPRDRRDKDCISAGK